ncbi:hypothetical protein O181_014695 [Austropuccinia psidii MF-1]|uniref:Reverse transcriptase/retrotransposon-derived protein RNase H-like domain-containing protein n=1 Tax=Austropuccinia psidii MF-1 TaxID=1389203 RepID=A0A9Q3C1F9_9BASI|nr:hypothetical protein [Austropuccinia psidii MF-1]
MELPPFSFHASLEEQWDEEEEPEEIETVLKVVPPAYHQYLDVFSKVEEEKLPPHCTCDHHIELEGSLPPEALSQFQALKEAFTTAPILSHFNPSLPTIVDTDASDYTMGAVMSQVNDSGKNPIAFDSRKLLPAELNYEIHDKQRIGIDWALKRWRAFLLSLSDSFEVLKYHSSLQYFISFKTSHSTRCHITLVQRVPREGVKLISKNPQSFHQVLNQNEIEESRLFSIKVEVFLDLVYQIQKEVWKDNDYKDIFTQLERGESFLDYSLEPKAKLSLFKDRVVIPINHEIQLDILQKCHESPFAGHPGQENTLKLIKRNFLDWNESNYQGLCFIMSEMFKKQEILP